MDAQRTKLLSRSRESRALTLSSVSMMWSSQPSVSRLIGTATLMPSTAGRAEAPTTAAAFGDRLYLPNARFNVSPPTPETEYWVTAVRR